MSDTPRQLRFGLVTRFFAAAAHLKLDRVEAALTLKDLAALPGNRFRP